MSTSIAYLRKRLADIGRYDLLDAAEAGLVSHFAAAEEAGLVRRREVLGNGSPNQAKKRAWTLARVTRQAEPLAPAKFSPGQAVPNFSQGARRTARDLPDLTAALAEWEEAQKPAPHDREREPAPIATPPVRPERSPFPAYPAIPCTSCEDPQAAAALREILNVYVAATRGEPHPTGSTLPRACCQWVRRHPDVRAMIA